MEKFNKKKLFKQVEKGEKAVMKILEECLEKANNMFANLHLTAYESSALAIGRLAEILFKIKMQTRQAKGQIEAVEKKIKLGLAQQSCKGCEIRGQNKKVADPDRKTPVS